MSSNQCKYKVISRNKNVCVNKVFVYFRDQVRILVEGFFTLNQDIPAFKEHLRDFLVQIKVFFMFMICIGVFVM